MNELAAAKNGSKSPKEAMRAYEEEMRTRALKEMPVSIAQAKMVHSWETLMNSPMIKWGMNKQKEEDDAERIHYGGSVEAQT